MTGDVVGVMKTSAYRKTKTGNTTMRLLVAGGRKYNNYELLSRVLCSIKPSLIISGAARGADRMALNWALEFDLPFEAYPVDHALDGPWPGAGPNRNGRMLRLSRPDMGLLFPGGNGTANMHGRLIAAGIPVISVADKPYKK